MFSHCHVAISGKHHLLFFAKSLISSICCHISYPLCFGSSTCFFAKSPLSSPLLCFADDEIIQVHTLYGIWADDQELMRNLASLAAAPTLPSPLFSVMMPWCSKFKIRWCLTCFWGLYHCYFSFFIYCCFIGLLWFIDFFYFLYLLAYLKHIFLHLLEQSTK